MSATSLPRPIIAFGLAGLIPQAICLALVLNGGPERWFALAAACFYAALILSFLGGMWWMGAMLGGIRTRRVYGMAVTPLLLGLAALLPWSAGWDWPGPSLVALSLVLLLSPLVDRALAPHVAWPASWLRLRIVLASALGSMTLIIAFV